MPANMASIPLHPGFPAALPPMTRRQGCHLGFGTRASFVIWTWFVIWALAFELYLSFASMRQSASPRLAIINGKPMKRIVRILTAKSAAGSHLTYEKELLNSGKNSHFYKTNHPGSPHGLPPYDPDNNIFRIYAQNDTIECFPFLLFASHKV
jgi:hypothetical protein